jgi:hypothetical protein
VALNHQESDMAEEKNETKTPRAFAAETQKQRWVKYGANVLLTCVIVVVLVVVLLYIFQKYKVRKDTTVAGSYSLKPQTVQLVRDSKQKIKLVGIFSRNERRQSERKGEDENDLSAVRYQQVADLLQEYEQKSGGRITATMIDHITEPGKVEGLFQEVQNKYGNDVQRYKEVMDAYPKTVAEIKKVAKEEIEALRKLPQIEDRKVQQAIEDVIYTVGLFPVQLDSLEKQVKNTLELKTPDYKGAGDAIKKSMQELSEMADAVVKQFTAAKDDAKTPKAIQEYMASSTPRFESLKKSADDLLKKTESLGELKQLDDLRQNKSNSIVVMGESDMKVLPLASVFKEEDARAMGGDGKVRERFAGEQQVSTALYTLGNKTKRKLAFVRSGGPPLTQRIMNYVGPYVTVADRLRDLDFEILEKDVSGQWAMQAMQLQMQMGMPMPPEPQDEQLKDALWVVVSSQQDPRTMMNPQAGQIGPKVADHLRNGGSALLMFEPQGDNFDAALKEWGIEAKTNYAIVHEKISGSGAQGNDMVSAWHREQPVFILNQYGDHMLAGPLRSLDGFFYFMVPISTSSASAKGVKTTNLLPIPQTPRPWGERDVNTVMEGKDVDFTPKKGDTDDDLPPPLFAGAAAEKEGGARLVVLGSRYFADNRWVRAADPEILRTQDRIVPRFPGNGELFVNSIYWLAKMETMIAISPAALEVPRVNPQMSNASTTVWQVLLIGLLPAMVLGAGSMVYLKRRD